jgi:hypothetical protein
LSLFFARGGGKKKQNKGPLRNTMETVLNRWLAEILQNIHESMERRQRHRKTAVGRKATSEKLAHRSDVAWTHEQTRYPSVNRGLVAEDVVSGRGEDIVTHCFPEKPRRELLLKQLADKLEYKGQQRRDFEAYMQHASDTAGDESWPARRLQLDECLYLPDNLRFELRGASAEARQQIMQLIMDQELRRRLDTAVREDKRDVVEQFLGTRAATYGSRLANELEVDLQRVVPQHVFLSDRDKCLLTFLHNVRKALHVSEDQLYRAPRNLKEWTVGKGLDRSRTALWPQYATALGLERMKVHARRAITMYTSGMAKIALALEDWIASRVGSVQAVQDRAEAGRREVLATGKPERLDLLVAGTRTIFNLVDSDDKPCFKHWAEAERCSRWTFGKESAASAILKMYMEFMDFMISPEPPLMLRSEMCVTAFYKAGEPFDPSDYDEWSAEKKHAFREEYHKFCARYLNVGFTFTAETHPKHGMRLLNLHSWGRGPVVPNPFRVKQDALLVKICGAYRLLPNRLGIGQHARQIWREHQIRYDFDPNYCTAFVREGWGENDWFPRPIFDVNFYEPGSGQDFPRPPPLPPVSRGSRRRRTTPAESAESAEPAKPAEPGAEPGAQPATESGSSPGRSAGRRARSPALTQSPALSDEEEFETQSRPHRRSPRSPRSPTPTRSPARSPARSSARNPTRNPTRSPARSSARGSAQTGTWTIESTTPTLH